MYLCLKHGLLQTLQTQADFFDGFCNYIFYDSKNNRINTSAPENGVMMPS